MIFWLFHVLSCVCVFLCMIFWFFFTFFVVCVSFCASYFGYFMFFVVSVSIFLVYSLFMDNVLLITVEIWVHLITLSWVMTFEETTVVCFGTHVCMYFWSANSYLLTIVDCCNSLHLKLQPVHIVWCPHLVNIYPELLIS